MTRGSLVSRGGAFLRRALVDPPPPLVAVEVRPSAVGLVRLVSERGKVILGAAALVELPEGTLVPAMAEKNVRNAAAFEGALKAVSEKAGLAGGGRIALVLPDPVARVSPLPVSEAKGRARAEREEMVRFRLRKTVPFEIRDAHLAFGTLPEPPGGEAQILVGAILKSILAEYETPCRELGLEPGLVTLGGLAIHEAASAGGPPGDLLVVNWDFGYVSLILSRGGALLLVRSLTGPSASSADAVAREVAQTTLYYRERLGGPGLSRVVLRSAALPAAEAADAIKDPSGPIPEILDPWAGLSPSPSHSGHALAGAAALLRGSAA